MNPSRTFKSITKIVESYKSRLAEMDEENFSTTPPIGGWSFSEVYSHIFDSSLLSLMALGKCIEGDGKNETTHFAVKLILLFGSLPPGKKYEVPTKLMSRVKKINLLEAEQFIKDFEQELAILYPRVSNSNPKIKVKHPRMGYLNAQQWFRFIEIHLKHHLKQIERIEASFV